MMRTETEDRWSRRARVLAFVAVLALVAAACGGDDEGSGTTSDGVEPTGTTGESSGPESTQDPNATDSGGDIMVWVDAPRVPAAEAFQAAFPDINIEINTIGGTVGGTDLQQQFALFNQAGEGWPDAIFFPSNDDIAWASSEEINYAADLTDLLPDSIIDGYDPAAIDPCVIDGRWRCLRNDVAPDVLWYNNALFEEFGYEVPTTWEEYEALSLTLAEEHPGYYTGLIGDAYAPNRYLWASGCPTNERLSATEVRIALDDANCTRIVEMLDGLVESGAVTPIGIFDSAAATDIGPNLLMTPGATWYGNFLFRDTWGLPADTVGAAKALRWEGEDPGFTGNEGGGFWGVSSHITGAQLENTLKFAEFVCCDERWQVELSTGLPAFGPNQQPWLEKQQAAGYFYDVDNAAEVFVDASSRVRPGFAYLLYNTGGIWSQTVTQEVTAGTAFSDAFKSFKDRILSEAQAFGYQVVEE